MSLEELPGDGEAIMPPESLREPLAGSGPVVLAVSCRDGLGQSGPRYAADVGARELITLHVPGVLAAPALRGLARKSARELQSVNNRGVEKHLLLLGPSALAVLAGQRRTLVGQ
jgi:hypothetical protein